MSSATQTHPHHPHHPQPAAQPAPSAPAPQPQGLQPLKNWSFPFTLRDSKVPSTPQAYFNALSHAEDGFYPLGANGIWHGGIHFGAGTDGALRQGDGVRAIADGEVVAYLLDSKYPELHYSDGKKAAYSAGFVLVHHKLAIPPAPASLTQSPTGTTPSSGSHPTAQPATTASTANAAAASLPDPPADEVLDFYSLYMHLLDWAGYQAAEQNGAATGATATAIQRLPFWKGDRHFRVGKKASDHQDQPAANFNVAAAANSTSTSDGDASSSPTLSGDVLGDFISAGFKQPAPMLDAIKKLPVVNTKPAAVGINIRDRANGKKIGLLPQGSEITITGTATSGWAQIAQILKGAPVGLVVGQDPAPNAATGWIFLDQLDSLIDPNPLDTIVILDSPFPVKAGSVIGYLGEYQRYSDASVLPPKPKRSLVHVEVFAGVPFVPFMKKSQDRAKSLPKNMLVVSPGATLVMPAPTNQTVAQGLRLKVTADDPNSGPWAKVQPMQAAAATGVHGNGHGHGHGHSHHHPAETPSGDPLWVERSAAGKVSTAVTNGWKEFPLQLTNAKLPAAGFQDVFSRLELDHLDIGSSARDGKEGAQWWQITVGTAKGENAVGWVCEKNHPQTQWQSQWAWPGFDVVDNTSVSVIDMFKRFLFVTGQLFDGEGESFKLSASNVNSSQLISKLEKVIDHDSDGTVTAKELAQAQATPWLAEALSHLIVRYETEWGGSLGKWDELSPLMKDRGYIWQSELQRIQKLQWWDAVKAVKGFPAESAVYHFHPIGLIGNFIQGDSDLDELIKKIGDIIALGEGNYEAYNTGTATPTGPVLHYYPNPPAGTVTGKTINEIIASGALPASNTARLRATGKYQTITPTLSSGRAALGLTGDEKYDADMQERFFRDYLLNKAGGGKLAAFVKKGQGTVDDAQFAASQEWASIAAPSGRAISTGAISNGTMSYYQGSANSANSVSTTKLRKILEEIAEMRQTGTL
jgi:hypothetical protein